MSKEAKMKEAMEAAKANAVEAEGVKDVEETTETVDEQKYTVELSKEQYDKLLTILEPEEKVGFMKKIKNKIHKPNLKKVGIAAGVVGAVVAGVAVGAKVASKKDDVEVYDEPEALPDNNFDDYKSNEDVYETQEETETEVTEF